MIVLLITAPLAVECLQGRAHPRECDSRPLEFTRRTMALLLTVVMSKGLGLGLGPSQAIKVKGALHPLTIFTTTMATTSTTNIPPRTTRQLLPSFQILIL